MTDDWSLIERALEVAARLYDPQAPGVESDLDRMEEAVAALGRLCEQAESAEKKARAAGDSCVRLGLRFLAEQKRAELAEARAERAEKELEEARQANEYQGWELCAAEADRDAYKKALEDEANRSCRADGCPPKTFGRCGHQFARAVLAALGVSEPTEALANPTATTEEP